MILWLDVVFTFVVVKASKLFRFLFAHNSEAEAADISVFLSLFNICFQRFFFLLHSKIFEIFRFLGLCKRYRYATVLQSGRKRNLQMRHPKMTFKGVSYKLSTLSFPRNTKYEWLDKVLLMKKLYAILHVKQT